jgi:hypothetical protein
LKSIARIASPLDPAKPAFEFVFGDTTQAISKITGVILRPNESLEKLIENLLGRCLEVDEDVDLEKFLGAEFEVVVVAKGLHGRSIESIRPITQ